MKKIKSKKSYIDIDFEDLFDEKELKNNKKCNKKKKKKHKSSKKSSKNKNKQKITKLDIEITKDFFGLNDKQAKQAKTNYKIEKHHHSKSWLGRIADCINVDARFDMSISDDCINNLFLIASGIISRLLFKK